MGFQDALDDIGNTVESAVLEGREHLTLSEEEHVLKLAQEALRQYKEEGWLES